MENQNIKSVFSSKDYGAIYINLDSILEQRGITYNKLSNSIGTDFDLVSRYAKNKIIRVDLDILSRICYVLDCNVSDILIYQQPENK